MTNFEAIGRYHAAVKKAKALKAFILSDKYDALPEIDRVDLKDQLGHMKRYFGVLSRRASSQCNNA